MDTYVVSVGVPVGQLATAVDDSIHVLRLGSQWAALDAESAGLWARALVPMRRELLEGSPGVRAQLDELAAAGALVIGWADGTPSSEVLDLVPIPLSVGRGVADDGSGMFVVASWQGGELVRLDAVDYQVWARLDGRTSVRRALNAAARELALEPLALRHRVPALLTALLASRAIIMDAP